MQQSTSNISDEEILNLLQNDINVEQAFRWLVLKYQERLYGHIRRMVNGHEDANDVIQNTFIKVFKNIKKFEGKAQLYTWLYRIATNETITFLNKKKRKATISIDDGDLDMANRLSADSYFDGNLAQSKLNQAVELLPEKQKLVFNMRYFEEMSYREISDMLETSIGGLKASYHHAVKKIEHFLNEQTDV
ncbi:MAG: RNA polymerase sigma-70 factor (ECF subfamily) [Granulosicoccus sp.]